MVDEICTSAQKPDPAKTESLQPDNQCHDLDIYRKIGKYANDTSFSDMG